MTFIMYRLKGSKTFLYCKTCCQFSNLSLTMTMVGLWRQFPYILEYRMLDFRHEIPQLEELGGPIHPTRDTQGYTFTIHMYSYRTPFKCVRCIVNQDFGSGLWQNLYPGLFTPNEMRFEKFY